MGAGVTGQGGGQSEEGRGSHEEHLTLSGIAKIAKRNMTQKGVVGVQYGPAW